MNPIVQIPVPLSYVPPVALTNSTSAGSMSLTLTPVALVPFAALVTVIVHITVSPIWYKSLSTVLLMDTSANGLTVIGTLTFLVNPSGVLIFQVLFWSPIASHLALMIIVAFVFAVMFVTTQVRFLVVLSKLTTFKPVMLTTSKNVTPSGRMSIRVRVPLYVTLPVFMTVKLYSTSL